MLKTAKCTRCGATHTVDNMVQTTSPKRGERKAYICLRCATTNEHYHASNNVLQGTRKVNQVGIGIEFETSYSDEKARNQMFEYGFIPTHDCSLNSEGSGSRYGWDGNACEYVSGIMQGLNKASKFCVTAEKLMQGEHMKVNASCGTHLHVSINSMKDEHGNKTYIGYIQRFYNSLFTPLCEAMKSNPEKTIALFGRYFDNHYTRSIDMGSYADDRYNFINVLNNSNIEYRICRFNNAKQYQECMRFCVKATQTIVANFCEHFNDEPKDARRYPNKTAYRKHKADMTAKKLVKYFFESVEKLEA